MEIKKVIENLNKNNIDALYVEKIADVKAEVEKLLVDGATVAVGGSMSLFESGVMELLKSGKYDFLDRYKENLTPDEVREIYQKSFFAQFYLCSTNALTEDGELYNVDGNSNRIAAICYGPETVIMVVGINKIVKNIDEAVERVKKISAPKNCHRLSCETYCYEKGNCISEEIGKGCGGSSRICCNYLVSGYQRKKGRIKVILVGENLGY